jgi:diguanylate cyclase (GGDEF)-like protein
LRPELVIANDKVMAVRLAGQEFPCEPETLEAIIPKKALIGFKLSEVPEELIIKPVESIADGQIEIKHDISLSSFANGSASAMVEFMLRRKFWDADVGLSPYIEAFRQAIRERDDAEESDFQDDGDYIILHYEVTISEDLEVQRAIERVESTIAAIEKRAEQLTHRRLDPLTGIFDRGTFDADLSHALQYPKAYPVSLLVIDLDKFKPINDGYGHPAGDEVLQKTANVIRLACEGRGSGYRYGGDEMAVLLPKHNIQQAVSLAEQIRSGMAELKFELNPERITASIGATSYPEVTKDADDIFSDADAMVYQAKEDGGNAVRGVMASEMRVDSARTMRLDIASRVEAVELWMRLTQGNQDQYSASITNDSDEDVAVEAITMKQDNVYLSEPTKPSAPGDWKIEKRSSRTINWKAKMPPVAKLKLKMRRRIDSGEIIEVDIVLWGRVLGRRRRFAHTILVTVDSGTNSMAEFL